MQIISPDYLSIDGEYKKGYSVAFDEQIRAVGVTEDILSLYPKSEHIATPPHSVLYPGFINTHVHLEFSGNSTTLRYGSFMPWLSSVIQKREMLTSSCTTEIISEACQAMLQSGITSFGAISSMGLELDACVATPQRVVLFHELIGSDPQSMQSAFENFVQRFEASAEYQNMRITPAVAIHSPYSVHPDILGQAVAFAKERNAPLSAHFLESRAEREWLESSTGAFKPFFESFLNQTKAATTIEEFLASFDGYPAHFTHCVEAHEEELRKIALQGHTIAHCPRSNRLLGCGTLDIEKLGRLNIPFSVATDGLSSNYSLNIFDELRAALMMHARHDLLSLSKKLIRSVTLDAAKILHLNAGRIASGYDADLALVVLPQAPEREEDIALWTILHTQKVTQLYIGGKQYV